MGLKMMCFGVKWEYGKDAYDLSAKVPPLPGERMRICNKAQEAMRNLAEEMDVRRLPNITPATCLLDRYTEEQGGIGQHRDNAEEKSTIRAGLPVISITLGATMVFGYRPRMSTDNETLELGHGDLFHEFGAHSIT